MRLLSFFRDESETLLNFSCIRGPVKMQGRTILRQVLDFGAKMRCESFQIGNMPHA